MRSIFLSVSRSLTSGASECSRIILRIHRNARFGRYTHYKHPCYLVVVVVVGGVGVFDVCSNIQTHVQNIHAYVELYE